MQDFYVKIRKEITMSFFGRCETKGVQFHYFCCEIRFIRSSSWKLFMVACIHEEDGGRMEEKCNLVRV